MISFPNAKINLGLYVTNKRSDGFHDIETCFYPIPWKDILEIIPSEQTVFTHSGIEIPGNNESNLCLKTVATYLDRYSMPPVYIHLHKNIPIGAGLGGGSSDAAFTAKSLNTLFELNLDSEQLENSVRSLGSDCAFFIQNEPIIAVGKGDFFTEKKCVDLSGYWIYLIYPSIHVSTKDAYSSVLPQPNRKPISDILKQDIATWKKELINDFEVSVFKTFPQLRDIKNSLYANGAIYASMSGSGSTLFGIFQNTPQQIMESKKHSFLIAEL
jgi:4-diphosphocytidyl-2-C-methyl-D-erythritol kinase